MQVMPVLCLYQSKHRLIGYSIINDREKLVKNRELPSWKKIIRLTARTTPEVGYMNYVNGSSHRTKA